MKVDITWIRKQINTSEDFEYYMKKILQVVNLSPNESIVEKLADMHPMKQITYASILQVVVFLFMLLMFKVIGSYI